MYLRETRRTNKDGTVVRYLQLAHNTRHPVTGASTASVIHNFGRAETVDRDALARLVSSISRFLDPADAVAAAAGTEVDILDSRRLGGAWVLDQLWTRLGIGAALHRAAAGRRLDAGAVERAVFTLVAQRALEPASKLAACTWVEQRVAITGVAGLDTDAAYAGMDFLLDALPEIASQVFASVAHLLNLDVDIVFVDTSSTYFETDRADETLDTDTDTDTGAGADDQTTGRDDENGETAGERAPTGGGADVDTPPTEAGTRAYGKSKDHRPELPQVVLALAVTRDGIPIRCWTFPGDTADQPIIRRIKDDLSDWNLRRLVWVADRGFASATNRAYLTRGGGSYIHAEKLRHTNHEAVEALARAGRYHTVAGNLRVKEVTVGAGGDTDGARAQRFVVCHNPETAARDAAVRGNLVEHLGGLIADSDTWTPRRRDEFVGTLKTKPGVRRYLRRTKTGLLRIDSAAIKREAGLDGKWLLRTSDQTLTGEDIAAAYKQLLAVERGWRDMKSSLRLRPVFHHREDRIRSHIQLCWLALLLIRVVETTTADTWRNLRHELDRLHLVTLATGSGTVAQRSELTDGQRKILTALKLPEPPRFYDFTTPPSR